MRIFEKYNDIECKKRVAVLGNFDGVHLGHAALIRKATALAAQHGFECCVYTFKNHPSNFKDGFCGLITDNAEKAEIISELGADILFFDDFDNIQNLSCTEFCRDILVGKLGCEIAVCGENFGFGKNRCGTSADLELQMKNLGKSVVISRHICDKNGEIVNSTAIRRIISEGDMEKAAEYLGRPFSILYPVIHGRHLGTQIGIPTVNQSFSPQKLKPANGVYACLCHVDGKKYCGVANVGTKPTVTYGDEDAPILCETHIIGYTGDLYGQHVKIEFFKRLRDEKKFSSLDELTAAVRENVEQTKKLFADREDVII